jgi:hypothetical protein
VYPLSQEEKRVQKEFIETNTQLGRIWRSKSLYASGFFLIWKKDGKYCPVQDYCHLNTWTIPNKYPLPLITDLIHDLAGKKLFTKFDIWWGYNNICIKEGDKWKAAFKTSEGLFEPTVMFFGLTNSPATFQTMMDDIFQEEVAQGWLKIYMDDMIIATEDDEKEHGKKVAHVLQKLLDHDLFLKPEKCQFHKKEVEYLGVIIGGGKVKMDPIKVKGITEWPIPNTVKEICSFLGFCNFYWPFILNFSSIAQPLNDLTKKNQQWHWGETKQVAFNTLKKICTSKPVLRSPDWTKKFILETDASGYALGVVISQEFEDGVHPITFHSWSLQPAEKNYDAHDKELTAVVFGFKCGHPLFLGAQHTIEVKSNHKNLQYFREPQKVTGRQARWIQFLQDFDYSLTHVPGHTNTIANLLSQRKDLNKGVNTKEPCILLPSSLFSKKVFLEDNLKICWTILQELHDGPSGGHPGIANTWNIVKRSYKGPRLWQFVEEYVKGCAKCQESKTNFPQKKVSLHPFDTAVNQGPFQYISMDLITDLPTSDGHDSILTIVDQGCSKAAKFIPCSKMINGQGIANEYLKHLVPWFGLPKRIISDWDPRFTSHFSKTLCKNLGVQQNLSTAFHPRTDGQIEWMNAWIEQYLHPWTSSQPHIWARMLPIAKYAHNSWTHDGTQQTPHYLLTGHTPQVNVQLIKEHVPVVTDWIKELIETRSIIQERLKSMQDQWNDCKTPEFTKKDQVWLEAKNLKVAGNQKLMPKQYGPYQIIEKINPVAYWLWLPPMMKIHDVFHVDLLSPYKAMEAYGEPYTHPPPIMEEKEEQYEIDAILDMRRYGRKKTLQYLVHWKGYPHADDSWVNHKELHAPDLLKEYYHKVPS